MRSNQKYLIFVFGNVTFFAFQRSALPVQARRARQRHLCCTCVYRKQNTIWHSMTSNARHCLYNVQLCRLSLGESTTMFTFDIISLSFSRQFQFIFGEVSQLFATESKTPKVQPKAASFKGPLMVERIIQLNIADNKLGVIPTTS